MVLAEMKHVELNCLTPQFTLTGEESRPDYLSCYLYPLIERIRDRDGFVAQKILAQAHLQAMELGDPNTWLVSPEDTISLNNIVQKYASTDRLLWIGVATDCDSSDPAAIEKSLETGVRPDKPLLYRGPQGKGLTHPSELADFHQAIDDFSDKHPGTNIQCYKIFPQDLGKNTAIARTVFDHNRINVRQYLSTLNAREDERKRDLKNRYAVDIEIVWPFADQQPVIIVDQLNDARFLFPHLESLPMWKSFDMLTRHYYSGITPVATEFMVKNPGKPNGSIEFFNDINASSTRPKTDRLQTLTYSIFERLGSAPIITSKQKEMLHAIETISNQLPESADRLGIHQNDVLSIQSAIKQLTANIPAWELTTTEALTKLIESPSQRIHAQVRSMLRSSLSKQPTLSQLIPEKS